MMPEEPNRSEELLKRYAKERRAQGGDFPLHSATRRLLQGEVARTLGKQQEKKQTLWSVWFGTWTGRVASGTVAATVLATGFLLVWNARQDRHAMELAQASVPERDVKYAAAPGQSKTALGEKKVALADAAPLREELTRGVALAASPVDEVTLKKENWFDDSASRLAVNGPAPAQDAPVNGQKSYTSYFSYDFTTTKPMDNYALSLTPVPNTTTLVAQSHFATANYSASPLGDLRGVSQSTSTQVASAASGFDKALAYGLTPTNGALVGGGATLSFANGAATPPPALLPVTPSEPQPMLEFSELAKAKAAPQLVTRSRLEEQDTRYRFVNPNEVPPAQAAAPASPAPAPRAAISATANDGLDRQQLARSKQLAENAAASSPAPGAAAATERYYRVDSRVGGIAKEARAEAEPLAAATSPVLSSFSIEQTGNTVRLVDADGSVYDGTVEAPLPVTADFDTDGLRIAEKDALFKSDPARPRPDPALRHQELSFRVTGSNVTLRQNVVVSARLLSRTNGTASAAGFGGSARPEDPAKMKADLAARRLTAAPERGFAGRYGFTTNSAAAIEGTVRVGVTNHQWFRAVRQP